MRSFSPHPLPKLSPAMRYIPPPSPSPQLTVPAMDREIPGFYVIIPAGGAGTRLWPLSRENHPKFLLDIDLSGRSLLQSTWHRLVPLAGAGRMTVVAGPFHSEAIKTQLPQLESSNLFTEPGPKDSMAAIGLAAAILLHRDQDAVIGSFAADHMIAGEDAFLNSVTEAVKVAKEGFLVTIGIAPSHPATGFGYVKLGDKLDVPNAPSARLVSSFKEKPDAYTAAKYLSSGNYRWNAGMFVTKASTLMDLVKEFEPDLHGDLTRIAEAWEDKAQREAILSEVWPALEKVAIDNAIAEPAAAEGKVAVIPATFGKKRRGRLSVSSDKANAVSQVGTMLVTFLLWPKCFPRRRICPESWVIVTSVCHTSVASESVVTHQRLQWWLSKLRAGSLCQALVVSLPASVWTILSLWTFRTRSWLLLVPEPRKSSLSWPVAARQGSRR